ncbi:MAG TPA: Clp protease N-terminal domain-containing protein [Candidatus Competibacter sp.]|nr:peptidase [Candidatus Competibacteraceae bacterium]HUM96146.1 Clp protease N-terminal domain-containing protein [Candidatus Competibacter sp.]
MLNKLRQQFRDIKTIKSLFEKAEQHANASGQREPGSEHFVMAAFDLPDGTAQNAFRRLNADPNQFATAVAQQYSNALRDIGMEFSQSHSPFSVTEPVPANNGMYQAKPSVRTLIEALWELKKANSAPLLGAHVVLAAISAQFGVIPRTLQSMGVEPASLAAAARAEIAVTHSA